MAYCVHCGNSVGENDGFCGRCGAAQRVGGSAPPPPRSWRGLENLTARQAAILCYLPLVGWLSSIIVLASGRFNHDQRVRFHAFQGLYLFAAWMLVDWVISPALFGPFGFGFPWRTLSRIFKLVIMGAWVFMLIRVSNDQDYHLPLVGELAERSVSEQRR